MDSLRAKLGPLPVWGWLVLVTLLLAGYWLYEKYKSGSTAGASGTAQVPETVNQVQVTNTPPTPPSDAAALTAEQQKYAALAKTQAGDAKTLAAQKAEIAKLEQEEKNEDKGKKQPSLKTSSKKPVVTPAGSSRRPVKAGKAAAAEPAAREAASVPAGAMR